MLCISSLVCTSIYTCFYALLVLHVFSLVLLPYCHFYVFSILCIYTFVCYLWYRHIPWTMRVPNLHTSLGYLGIISLFCLLVFCRAAYSSLAFVCWSDARVYFQVQSGLLNRSSSVLSYYRVLVTCYLICPVKFVAVTSPASFDSGCFRFWLLCLLIRFLFFLLLFVRSFSILLGAIMLVPLLVLPC